MWPTGERPLFKRSCQNENYLRDCDRYHSRNGALTLFLESQETASMALWRQSGSVVRELVSCPGHNIIGSDPSDNYETESGGADDHGRRTERVEQVGCITHVAR